MTDSYHKESVGFPLSSARLLVGMLLFALTLLYGEVLFSLITWWVAEKRWQLLIIPIALYMVFMERKALRALPIDPMPRLGLVLMLLSGTLLIVARLGAHEVWQGLSLPLMLFGLCFGLLGKTMAARLFWPLMLLGLMTPLFAMRIESLNYPLQIISANFAYTVLHLAGLEITKDANFLHLPHISLSVAYSCSGFNQVLTLATIAVPLGYITQRRFGRQLALIAISFPIAILSNGVRVTAIALYNYWTPHPDMVHGPHEIFRTTFIPAFGLILLFWIAALMGRHQQETRTEPPSQGDGSVRQEHRGVNRPFGVRALLLIGLLCGALALIRLSESSPRALSQQLDLANSGWTERSPTPEERNDVGFALTNWYLRPLRTHHRIYRAFEHSSGLRMSVVQAGFAGNPPGNEMVNHTIENDIRGYMIASQTPHRISDTIALMDVTLDSERSHFRYWLAYRIGTRFYTDRASMRWALIRHFFTFKPPRSTLTIARLDRDMLDEEMARAYHQLMGHLLR